MAVLGIIGSGKATAKIVTAGLDDRRALIDEDKDDFWFLVAYDGKPSPSLAAATKWLRTSKTYYEVVVPTRSKIDDEVIDGAAKVHKASDIYTDVVTRLESDEDDDKALLVLYQEDDEPQDDAVRTALARGIDTLDLGNALEPFEVEEGEAEPDDEDETPEEEEEEEAPKKAPASKKPAGSVPPPPEKRRPGRPRKAAAEPAEEPEETTEEEEEPETAPEPPKRRTRASKTTEEATGDHAKIVAEHQASIGSDSFADLVADKVVKRLAGLLAQPF